MDWTQEVLKPMLAVLMPVLTGLAGWLAFRGAGLLKAHVEGKRQADALTRLDHAVTSAVRGVEQARASKLPREAGRGTLSPADAAMAKAAAVAGARLYLGAHGWTLLQEVFGLDAAQLEDVIRQRVESALYELKTGAPSPATAPAAPTSIPAGARISDPQVAALPKEAK